MPEHCMWCGSQGWCDCRDDLDDWIAAQERELGEPACPYPIKGNRTVAACVRAGTCGCGATDDATAAP